MDEVHIYEESLVEAYHASLMALKAFGDIVDCPDYNTTQKELSATIVIENPLKEPRISKLFIGGYRELQQYCMEMLDGILDFEVKKGNWQYTYHSRMTEYPIDNQIKFPSEWCKNQIDFILYELNRNPSSRRAVIDVRDNSEDMYTDDPACLQHIQFFIRENKLHMKVLFRSNDACKAAFMNMFALIMLQKRIADRLGIEVGTYTHRANSYHCYERDFKMLDGYVNRIETESLDDITYSYEDDWKDLMEDSIEDIMNSVNKLKGDSV